MRILLVTNLYPPYWIGGYEQAAAWVAAGLRGRGHEVTVLTGRGPELEGVPGVCTGLDLDLPALCEAQRGDGIAFAAGLGESVARHVFSRRNAAAAQRRIASARPDLMSFWNPAFVSFSPLLAARRAGVPSLVHASDAALNPFRNPHRPAVPRGLGGIARLAVDALIRRARPRRVAVPSRFLRRRLLEREGLSEAQVEVLPWPVAPEISRAGAPGVARGPRRRLLFVGSLVPEKGCEVLIEALRRALAREPTLTLDVLGDGPRGERARLARLAEGLPVRFRGRLERAAVLDAYRSADLLALPSVWDEPFSLVPLEALAMGVPVIATATGGTPELIEHERTGLLVPPRDPEALCAAILSLAADPGRATALAAEGQRRVREELSFDAFMDRLERLYREVAP